MEYSAFEKVPRTHQTFSFWDQFVFWFSAASLPAAWYYGALAAGWKGIIGAAVIILAVNTISLIPWAYLGEIAGKTGGSSMAIVRGAFGIRGSVVPSIFYLVMGFGWAAVNVFLGAIALSFIFKLWLGWPSYADHNNLWYMVSYIMVVCILQGWSAISGHTYLKKLQWAATIFFFILGFYQTFIVLRHWNAITLLSWHPAKVLTASIGPFVYPITVTLLIDLLIAYNWTWEFIGDFSRFSRSGKASTWGPFWGTQLAQLWWFIVGALAVVYLAVSTGEFSPLVADPSSTTVTLGLGWLAALIILFATITTNAGNLYASALGLSNIFHKSKISLDKFLIISAVAATFLSLTPLLSGQFVGFYILFLDVVGAVVVPMWTITLVDYFIVKKRKYSDDLFKKEKGEYWYSNGWNYKAVITLISGTVLYWVFGYVFPAVRHDITATIPTVIYVSAIYLIWMRKK